MKKLVVFAVFACTALAQMHPQQEAIEAAMKGPASPGLKDVVAKTMTSRGGIAVWGQDFLFVTESAVPVGISLNEQPPLPMTQIEGSKLWMRLEKMRTGVTYSYQYHAGGKAIGTRADLTGYNPDSYPKPGVARGTISDKKVIISKIYGGMQADYWIYASPGVNPKVPAALMVWQDGAGLIAGERSRLRLSTVTENLVAQKLIPPMVHVLISPGLKDGKAMRSVEYDTVSNAYTRFLMEEVLPEVEKSYKLRPDGYSRGIGGESSGGICAFTSAWFMPEKFARVHSTIGSFTSIQWRAEEKLDGGNLYPFKVRKQPKRNIRVWMSDGANDLENNHGSWPLQNIQLANSLKMKEYDFHFRFGSAAHNGSQAALDLPESLNVVVARL